MQSPNLHPVRRSGSCQVPQARPYAVAVLPVLCSEGKHAGCGATHPARTKLITSLLPSSLDLGWTSASVRQGRAATRLTLPAPVINVACGTSCNLGRVSPSTRRSRAEAGASCGLALLHAWVPPVVRGASWLAANSVRKEGDLLRAASVSNAIHNYCRRRARKSWWRRMCLGSEGTRGFWSFIGPQKGSE